MNAERGGANRLPPFKFFNVFGPNEYHKGEMMSVICKRFPDVEAGKPIRLFKSYHPGYKDGEQKRDFIYVKDVVKVMYYFFAKPRKSGIFNLGTGNAQSWNKVAQTMFSAMGMTQKIEYIDMPQEIKSAYQYFTQANIEKLKNSGYPCKFTPIEDSIRNYLSYLKTGSYL